MNKRCDTCIHYEICKSWTQPQYRCGNYLQAPPCKIGDLLFVPVHDEDEGEWISVDERLPRVIGKYICCVKNKDGNTWTITADYSPEMKTWFGQFGEVRNTVTHWMPLPEPPDMKGGGAE